MPISNSQNACTCMSPTGEVTDEKAVKMLRLYTSDVDEAIESSRTKKGSVHEATRRTNIEWEVCGWVGVGG